MYLVWLLYLLSISVAVVPVVHAQNNTDDELEMFEYDDEDETDEEEAPVLQLAAADVKNPAAPSIPISPVTPVVVKPEEAKPAGQLPAAPEQPKTEAKPETPVAAPEKTATETKEAVPAPAATAETNPEAAEAPKGEAAPATQENKPEAAQVATGTKSGDTTQAPAETPVAKAPEATAPAQEAAPAETTEKKPEAKAPATEQPQPEQKPVAVEQPQAQPEAQPAPQPKAPEAAPAAPEPAGEVKPVVPPLPEPPKPTVLTPEQQQKIMAEAEQGEIASIDTVDLESPEGNWLLKKIWWEKSQNLYGKIRSTVDQIADARMHFYDQHVRIDRDVLDPFYSAVGFDQGQLTEIANTLTAELEKKRQKRGSLDEKELEYYTTVINAKTTIENFKAAVQSISQLSNDMGDALVKLAEQLNKVRAYEGEAWRLLTAIGIELNDKKAREYYYGVLTQWQNIKDIDAYIFGPYSQHFSQLVKALQTQTKTIKDSLEDLKNKGIKYGVTVKEHLEGEEEPEAEEVPAKPAPKKGWFDWLWSFLGWK
jgi:hypothetical protein